MSIRTAEDLSDRLADDLIWRKKELTVLRKLVAVASVDREVVLVRSLVAILYAHWEGFLKNAGSAYLEYLSNRRLSHSELAPNFLALVLRARIQDATSRRNLGALIEIVKLFRGGLADRARIPKDAVDAEANLSSRVLYDIVTMLGLDYAPFETKAVLIDERLLSNRNAIAHGDYLSVEKEDILSLSKDILEMMESFRNQIENAVALRDYRY